MNTEFKVVVRMQVHGAAATLSSMDVWLERHFTLPFAPTIGLTVEIGGWSCKIEELYWDVEKQHFRTYVEADRTFYEVCMRQCKGTSKQEEPTLEGIVHDHMAAGWQHERKDRRP